MKLAAVSRGVETDLQSSAFQIGDHRKLFAILADKIYSDKPRAVVREYVSNALDIHLRTGQTRPFEVSMPNAFDPSFKVRDFGTGLRPDLIQTLFCTFFASDKTNSNSELGGFGLGSKAGFAYTDSFTVTSFQGGQKTIYAAFRGDDGIPQISTVGAMETDEPDGLEIKIPVQRADYADFIDRAQDILRWFPEGSFKTEGFEVEMPRVNVRNKFYLEVTDQDEHVVLMGPIAYAVNWNIVGVSVPESVVPIFEVGELDLPPSREALSYDPQTIARLKARAEAVNARFCQDVLRSAVNLSPRQRIELTGNLQRAGLYKVFDNFHKSTGHRAKDEAARKASSNRFDFEPKWGTYLLYAHEHHKVPGQARVYDRGWIRGRGQGLSSKFSDRQFVAFDQVSHFVDRAYFFFDVDERAPRIFERLQVANCQKKSQWIIYEQSTWDELQKLVPDAEFYQLSEFEPPVKTRAKTRVKHHVYDLGKTWSYEQDGELPESGVYIPYDGREAEYIPVGGTTVASLLHNRWAEEIAVYGLNKTAQSKVDMGEFVRLDRYLIDRAKQALQNPAVVRAMSAAAVLREARDHPLWHFVQQRGDLLPAVKAKVDALLADTHLDAGPINDLISCGLIKPVKTKDHHKVIAALDRAAKRNPVLMYCISPKQDWNHEILERIVK